MSYTAIHWRYAHLPWCQCVFYERKCMRFCDMLGSSWPVTRLQRQQQCFVCKLLTTCRFGPFTQCLTRRTSATATPLMFSLGGKRSSLPHSACMTLHCSQVSPAPVSVGLGIISQRCANGSGLGAVRSAQAALTGLTRPLI